MANATVCQKNMAKMHGNGNDNDLDSDIDPETTFTTTADAFASAIAANTLNFQNECSRLGFKINQHRAKILLKDFAKDFKNPADQNDYNTLFGSDGFSEYVSTYVNDKYVDKPKDEKLKLFLSLMANTDKYNEYVDCDENA